MHIYRVDFESAGTRLDTSVAIDVLRAFTTSAYAFNSGANEIYPVSTVEEAFDLKNEIPDSLLMGEIEGMPIEGFDLGNSPTEVSNLDLSGKRIIHRSTAGTQGIVKSVRSDFIFACSLCCISATVAAIQSIGSKSLTLVQTGVMKGGWGDEDVACGDMIEAKLLDEEIDLDSIINRVKNSRSGRHYTVPDHPVFPASNLDLALQVDRFDFFMQVELDISRLVMRRHYTAQTAIKQIA
jgi:2-phosphosulfolactate phosphatase